MPPYVIETKPIPAAENAQMMMKGVNGRSQPFFQRYGDDRYGMWKQNAGARDAMYKAFTTGSGTSSSTQAGSTCSHSSA